MLENSEIGLRYIFPKGKAIWYLVEVRRSKSWCLYPNVSIRYMFVGVWSCRQTLLIIQLVAGCPEGGSLPPYIVVGGHYLQKSLWSSMCPLLCLLRNLGCQRPKVAPFSGRFSLSSKLTEMEVNITQIFIEYLLCFWHSSRCWGYNNDKGNK